MFIYLCLNIRTILRVSKCYCWGSIEYIINPTTKTLTNSIIITIYLIKYTNWILDTNCLQCVQVNEYTYKRNHTQHNNLTCFLNHHNHFHLGEYTNKKWGNQMVPHYSHWAGVELLSATRRDWTHKKVSLPFITPPGQCGVCVFNMSPVSRPSSSQALVIYYHMLSIWTSHTSTLVLLLCAVIHIREDRKNKWGSQALAMTPTTFQVMKLEYILTQPIFQVVYFILWC